MSGPGAPEFESQALRPARIRARVRGAARARSSSPTACSTFCTAATSPISRRRARWARASWWRSIRMPRSGAWARAATGPSTALRIAWRWSPHWRASRLVTWFEEDTPLERILACRPDVLVKGGDWTGRSDRRRRRGAGLGRTGALDPVPARAVDLARSTGSALRGSGRERPFPRPGLIEPPEGDRGRARAHHRRGGASALHRRLARPVPRQRALLVNPASTGRVAGWWHFSPGRHRHRAAGRQHGPVRRLGARRVGHPVIVQPLAHEPHPRDRRSTTTRSRSRPAACSPNSSRRPAETRPPVSALARRRGQLPDRRQPLHQCRRHARAALRQHARAGARASRWCCPTAASGTGCAGLRKDNTGYDLKQLFLGAEGTLGIITAAVLKLYPEAAPRATAWCASTTPRPRSRCCAAARRLRRARHRLRAHLARVPRPRAAGTCPATRDPLPQAHPWYVLVELSDAPPGAGLARMLETALDEAVEAGLVDDAAVAVERRAAQGALADPRGHLGSAEARRRVDQARHLGAGEPGARARRAARSRRSRPPSPASASSPSATSATATSTTTARKPSARRRGSSSPRRRR